MSILNLLYKDFYYINDSIKVMIPKLGDVLNNEEDYYSAISMITATPTDMMVHLDDIGIDFTQISDYELFIIVFNSLKDRDLSLIFGDLDARKLEVVVNPQNGMVVLRDKDSGLIIDKGVYSEICKAIRKIHHIKVNDKKPANLATKKYMIQRARQKIKRRKNRVENSKLEELIVALVNTEQCSYNFSSILDLTIYQFNESVQQIISKIDYDNRMFGIYSGTISAKEMSQDDLNWLNHK